MPIHELSTTICNGNQHIELTVAQAIGYCSILAVLYVASLYGLVPNRISTLHRDDPVQIRWRAYATSIVCIVAITTYGLIFCKSYSLSSTFIPINFQTWQSNITTTFRATVGVVFHITILYVGVFINTFILFYETIRQHDGIVSIPRLIRHVYSLYITKPIRSIVYNTDSHRWPLLRNLVIAPITEEVVFRSCMVPVLYSTGMTTVSLCVVAPLFFGIAHLHHAILKLRQGDDRVVVILVALLQFIYTSMFGTYASYVYLRTRSLFAVVVCHSICNAMSLPDVSFLQKQSILYQHRFLLLSNLLVGIVGFWIGIVSFNLPPTIITQS
jgi:prenyl protein peptidase